MNGTLARDVMTTPVVSVHETTPIREVIDALRDKGYSGFPVVDPGGKAVGLVSQNDLFRALVFLLSEDELAEPFQEAKRRAATRLLDHPVRDAMTDIVLGLLDRPVSEVMTPSVLSCSPDDPLDEVCDRMASERVHRVIVLDDRDHVVGLISATDVVRHVAQAGEA